MENINSVSVNLELNKYHKNKRGHHSVRLYVFDNITKNKYYLKTPFKLSKTDFEGAWVLNKSNARLRNIRLEMLKFLEKVDNCINELGGFEKEEFKSVFYGTKFEKKDLAYYYNRKINEFKDVGGLGTAELYELSFNFLKKCNKNKDLNFNQITAFWLKKIDRHCMENGLLSTSTLGMYLRPLRTIFNLAIHEGIVHQDKYPFGKFGYSIPESENVKKALTKDQIRSLYENEPKNENQKLAKDFWFFSFLSYGLDLKDILSIKNKDIENDYYHFDRKKTLHTVKVRNSIKVYFTDYTKQIIKKYGNYNPLKPQDYVFNIFTHEMDNVQKRKAKKNFNRKINQHFTKFAESLGIKDNISFRWARHSFATIAILSGVRFEVVSKRLSHTSLETTMRYFKGFEEDTYKQVNHKILNFDSDNSINDSEKITNCLF